MAIAKAQSFEENCAKIGLALTPLEIATLRDCIPETFLWGPDSLDGRSPVELRDSVLGDITDWVLFVDADERISDALANEVRQKMRLPEYAGWRLPRHNYIFGVLTRGAGWYPDYQTRLLRVGHARYDLNRPVHETVTLHGAEGTMRSPIIHYNYRDLAHFKDKQERYTQVDVSGMYRQGIRVKPQNFVLQPLRQFWWRFVTLGGYRDRWHGLRLSLLMARYEYRKYQLLAERWQRR